MSSISIRLFISFLQPIRIQCLRLDLFSVPFREHRESFKYKKGLETHKINRQGTIFFILKYIQNNSLVLTNNNKKEQ